MGREYRNNSERQPVSGYRNNDRVYQERPARPPRNVIAETKVQIGAKEFVMSKEENARGLILTIREYSHGQQDRVVVPIDDLDKLKEFIGALGDVAMTEKAAAA